MQHMNSIWHICSRRDKSRNYCPRKLPGACHGDDFGLVEKWKSLLAAIVFTYKNLFTLRIDSRLLSTLSGDILL